MSTTSQPSLDAGQTPKSIGSRLALLVATFGYSGYAPKAPGTVGSALTVLLWWFPIFAGTPVWMRLAISLVICFTGLWASEVARRHLGDQKDPQVIVIDEVAGQSIALAFCWSNIYAVLAGFILFRFFDILKPGPIGWLDRNVKGGLGIMIDDIAAGIAAAVLIVIARLIFEA